MNRKMVQHFFLIFELIYLENQDKTSSQVKGYSDWAAGTDAEIAYPYNVWIEEQ